MAIQSLRLISCSDGQAWADLKYNDATMQATGVAWSNPFRLCSISIWSPTGELLYSGTPKDQGNISLPPPKRFLIDLTEGKEILPEWSFGISF